jgi:hypothetical protein
VLVRVRVCSEHVRCVVEIELGSWSVPNRLAFLLLCKTPGLCAYIINTKPSVDSSAVLISLSRLTGELDMSESMEPISRGTTDDYINAKKKNQN